MGSLLQWHRRSQLPLYRDALQELRAVVDKPLSESWLTIWGDTLAGFWQNLMIEISPVANELLSSLSADQVEEIRLALQEGNSDYDDEYEDLSAQERRQRRLENAEEFFERWLGDSSEEQQQLLLAWSARQKDGYPAWMENRLVWQQHFLKALQRRQMPGFEAEVELLFIHTEQLWTAAYRQAISDNTAQLQRLIIDIHRTMTPRQKEHLIKEIDYWLAIIDDLSVQPEAESKRAKIRGSGPGK